MTETSLIVLFYEQDWENELPQQDENNYYLPNMNASGQHMLTLVQKTTQVLLHMAVAFGVTYGFTGSLAVGGLAAVVEPICNVLLLPLHDRAWQRLRRRTGTALVTAPDAAAWQ